MTDFRADRPASAVEDEAYELAEAGHFRRAAELFARAAGTKADSGKLLEA